MKSLLFLVAILVAEVTSESADQYKDLIMTTHNDKRREQGGSNINKLEWSDTLAREADAWVSKCNFAHQMAGRGENLAINTAPDVANNIKQALGDWYGEIKDYSYAGKVCFPSSCHYSQMVWHSTKEVGCAMKRCPNWWFFACFYDPAGNNMAEYPYQKGAPCSECEAGQGCDNGLCS